VSLTLSWRIFYKRGNIIPFDIYTGSVQSVPYTAAIIYLASARRVEELVKSLTLVAMNLRTGSPWPIILFHTGDFDDVEATSKFGTLLLESLTEATNLSTPALRIEFIPRIKFSKLHWSLPEGIPDNVTLVHPVHPQVWPGK
jgi:mannosyltransferase